MRLQVRMVRGLLPQFATAMLRCFVSKIQFPLSLNLFWLAVVCCVVAQIEILRSALKTPAASDSSVPAPPRWSEVLWTLVPAVGLAVVLVFTWHAVQAHRESDTMRPIQRAAVVVERAS